jgi:hypothetical protein
MRGDVVHETAAKAGFAIDDHDLDGHGRITVASPCYIPTAAPDGPSFE